MKKGKGFLFFTVLAGCLVLAVVTNFDGGEELGRFGIKLNASDYAITKDMECRGGLCGGTDCKAILDKGFPVTYLTEGSYCQAVESSLAKNIDRASWTAIIAGAAYMGIARLRKKNTKKVVQ